MSEAIRGFYEDGKKLQERLSQVSAQNDKLIAMHLTENPHTKLSLNSLNEMVILSNMFVE